MQSEDNRPKTNIAVFASGRGSNAKSIINYFEKKPKINVGLIVSNKPDAKVLALADRYQIPKYLIPDKKAFRDCKSLLYSLELHQIDLIVLAGFLWLIPTKLILQYPDKIINIHPSLLPKYGGKGMYGIHVHQAVSQAGDKQSGITIHLVNPEYDKGRILAQFTTKIKAFDKPENIAKQVLKLEHYHYPRVIEKWLQGKLS